MLLRWLYLLSPDDGTETNNVENDDDQEDDEEPYDKQRAMALITKLREQNKSLRTVTKDHEALKKQIEDLELQDKSDLDKAVSKVTTYEQRIAQLESEKQGVESATRRKIAEMMIRSEAIKQGADDDLVFALVDIGSIEFTEPDEVDPIGSPQKVDKVVKSIIERKPAVLVDPSKSTVTKNGPPKTPEKSETTAVSTVDSKAIASGYHNRF